MWPVSFLTNWSLTLRNKMIIALAVVAMMASVSEACPFGRRKAKCQAQASCVAVNKPAPLLEVKPVPLTIPVVVPSSVSTCANGSCGNQALQAGPTRGFRLFR